MAPTGSHAFLALHAVVAKFWTNAVRRPDIPRYDFSRAWLAPYNAAHIGVLAALEWSLANHSLIGTSKKALEAGAFAIPLVLRPVTQQNRSGEIERFIFFNCVWKAFSSVR